MKKNYYKLALQYHPDRVSAACKSEANKKFNIIHNAYAILSDPEKKKLYDGGSNVVFTKATIAARWENFLKPVDVFAMETSRNKYQNSEKERKDIIREVVAGKGSMIYLLNNIPFMRVEDEDRIIQLVKKLMDDKKIPILKIKKLKK